MSSFEKAEQLILGRTATDAARALKEAGLLAPDEEVEVELLETWGGEPISSTCCGKCENECYVDFLTGERE